MTGYIFELYEDGTLGGSGGRSVHVVRVKDPFGEYIGEVRSLSAEDSLMLALRLKKGDKGRYAADHGLCA